MTADRNVALAEATRLTAERDAARAEATKSAQTLQTEKDEGVASAQALQSARAEAADLRARDPAPGGSSSQKGSSVTAAQLDAERRPTNSGLGGRFVCPRGVLGFPLFR